MTDVQHKIEPKNTNTMNTVAAGVVGAIAGGVAVAAAVLMSDEKNQKKVKAAFTNTKEKVAEVVNDAKQKVKENI